MISGMVSVVVPCCNYAEYVADAISSVRKQSYSNWECIVIDDGSTDNTADVVHGIAKAEPRVIYVHQDNQGLAASRNIGFQRARGEYIQFLDADDLVTADKFAVQTTCLRENADIGVCYTGYQRYYSAKSKTLGKYMPCELGRNVLEDFLFRWERGLSIPIHCAMFRRSLFKNAPFNNSPFHAGLKAKEDWLMWVQLARMTGFHYIDQDCALYRVHAGNMCKNKLRMGYYFFRAAIIIGSIIGEEFKEMFYEATYHHLTTYYYRPKMTPVKKLNEVASNIRQWQRAIARKVPAVLFGTGEMARWMLLMLDEHRVDVRVCFDNNNVSPEFQGLKVQRPTFIPEVYVIVASSYEDEILSQLLELGYTQDNILFFGTPSAAAGSIAALGRSAV